MSLLCPATSPLLRRGVPRRAARRVLYAHFHALHPQSVVGRCHVIRQIIRAQRDGNGVQTPFQFDPELQTGLQILFRLRAAREVRQQFFLEVFGFALVLQEVVADNPQTRAGQRKGGKECGHLQMVYLVRRAAHQRLRQHLGHGDLVHHEGGQARFGQLSGGGGGINSMGEKLIVAGS